MGDRQNSDCQMDYQDLFGTGFANKTRKELEKDRDHEQYALDQLLARYLSTPEGQAQGRIGVTHVNPVDPESDFGKLIIGGKIKLKTWSDLDPLFRIKVRQAEYLRNERNEFILIKKAENLANMSAMKRLADERRAKGKAARELFFATYIPKDKPQSSESDFQPELADNPDEGEQLSDGDAKLDTVVELTKPTQKLELFSVPDELPGLVTDQFLQSAVSTNTYSNRAVVEGTTTTMSACPPPSPPPGLCLPHPSLAKEDPLDEGEENVFFPELMESILSVIAD